MRLRRDPHHEDSDKDGALPLPTISCDVKKLTLTTDALKDITLTAVPDERDCDNCKLLITSVLKSLYSKSILGKLDIGEIVLCENIKRKNGEHLICVSYSNNIVLSTSCFGDKFFGFIDVARFFHYEIMRLMLKRGIFGLIDEKEFNNNRCAKYVGDKYVDYKTHPDFVSGHARKNIEEDICETYGYIMTVVATKKWGERVALNHTLVKKILVITNALKKYDEHFIKMSEKFYTNAHEYIMKALLAKKIDKPHIHCDIREIHACSEGMILTAPATVEESNSYKSLVVSTLKRIYSESISDKIDEIIICKTIQDKRGKYINSCTYSLSNNSHGNCILLSISDSDGGGSVYDSDKFTRILHYEIMNNIYENELCALISEREMNNDKDKDIKYVGDAYPDYEIHPNFVSQFARKDVVSDICDTYAYMLTVLTANWEHKVELNSVLLKKMLVITNALMKYDSGFAEITGKFYAKMQKNIGDALLAND